MTAIEQYNAQTPNLTKLDKPFDYPERLKLEDNQTDWQVSLSDYLLDRPYCVTSNLRKAIEKGTADPELISDVERTFEGQVDELGRPINPFGRTGIGGRGHIYNWGESLTVDTVAVKRTLHGDELLVIRKPGETKPALPGGFIDSEEQLVEAAVRETSEETGIAVDPSFARFVGKLITRSKRTTDHAWITTNGIYVPHDSFSSIQIPEGGDDAAEAKWLPLTNELLQSMSLHHRVLVQAVIELGDISIRNT